MLLEMKPSESACEYFLACRDYQGSIFGRERGKFKGQMIVLHVKTAEFSGQNLMNKKMRNVKHTFLFQIMFIAELSNQVTLWRI